MKKLIYLIALFVILFCCFVLIGCKSQTVYVPVNTVKTVTQVVKDTVVQIKLEKEHVAQTVKDTTSTLENKYAISHAIWHNGFLFHDLSTKPVTASTQFKYNP